jgi:hypothetical protein
MGRDTFTCPIIRLLVGCMRRKRFRLKPETEEHLKKVEKVVAEANHILARYTYPDDSRTVMVIGYPSIMIEHGIGTGTQHR